MLSLLSLLLASGTVLRADTEQWTSKTYPDPRTNSTLCNTWPNSTLCDPDHILTDQWRADINSNIQKQVESKCFGFFGDFLIQEVMLGEKLWGIHFDQN